MVKNIVIAGVGGQGLVLMTKVLSQTALNEGYDVKTNDVIGLSQRGGMVWGSVRYGSQVFSPNIPRGQADIILALEPLEALRWSYMLKEGIGKIIYNINPVYPTIVQQEKAEYPFEKIQDLENQFSTIAFDAYEFAKNLGNKQMANTVMLGLLSRELDFADESWLNSLRKNMKPKFLEMNIDAFHKARNLNL